MLLPRTSREGGRTPHDAFRAFAIRRYPSTVPAVQPLGGGDPNAPIRRSQHCSGVGARQALIGPQRRDRELAKAVQTVSRDDPDVTFSILENFGDDVARESARTARMHRRVGRAHEKARCRESRSRERRHDHGAAS